MTLKTAFNAISNFHSRPASLMRPGTPNIYSPIRITPSNYFRYLEGLSSTVVHGREFLIPIDTMSGHTNESLVFSDVPIAGSFILDYNSHQTVSIPFNATASDIQTALRDIDNLELVSVSGSIAGGFTITFVGVNSPVLLSVTQNVPMGVTTTVSYSASGTVWSPILKRGDRIIDSLYGHMTIDEIIEIPDIGGAIMGFRVRTE